MKLDRFIRLFIAFAILLVFVIAIAALLFVTESALNVWDRLLEGPRWLLIGYVAAMLGLLIAALWLTWRLVVKRKPKASTPVNERPMTREAIGQRLADAEAAGVDVSAAQQELRELAARQRDGAMHLCFFGEVSTGKSSLIRALAPEADVKIDVVGGSTTEITHFRWRDDEGSQILLTDVPGVGGHEAGLSELALEEAQRAQLVLFVCDSDLTRGETRLMRHLIGLGKPLVVVLNKTDQLRSEDQAVLMQRLLEHLDDLGAATQRDQVVAVSAGGDVDVIERRPDGSETRATRHSSADIGVLVVAINRLLDSAAEAFDARRDRAVFRLAADKLAAAETEYRQQRGEQIIRNATRKAVVGALAAVSPGTDVLIQGYIGTTMTRQLCELFGAAPRDLDIEEFLDMSQSRVGRALPLSLAVAGNALKAFPGLGTVAGGLVHAVAYGLIFDALGRSLVLTLQKHGELLPEQAAKNFEEGISEHIEAGAKRVARMALAQERNDPAD